MRSHSIQKILLLIIVVFLLSSVIGLSEHAGKDQEKRQSTGVRNIDTHESFSSIQEAIDDKDTLNGHTITVDAGFYNEQVLIDKSITLIGYEESDTIIGHKWESDEPNYIVEISADYVNMSGFILKGGDISGNADCGIYLKSDFCHVFNNTIDLLKRYNNGIALEHAHNNTLSNNKIIDNCEGIRLIQSNDNQLIENTVSGNEGGIYLYKSHHNVVYACIIEKSTNSGIKCEYSTQNKFHSNIIKTNTQSGMSFTLDSDHNLIYDNHFDNINNTYDTSINMWNSSKMNGPNIIGGPFIGGNYFSDYVGSDANDDGFGDSPYLISGGNNQDVLPLIDLSGLSVDKLVATDSSGVYENEITVNIYEYGFVSFKVLVTTNSLLDSLSVKDILPNGLSYLPGSSTVNGVNNEPFISGQRLFWNLSSAQPMDTFEIIFDVAFSTIGDYHNIIQVIGQQTVDKLYDEDDAWVHVVDAGSMLSIDDINLCVNELETCCVRLNDVESIGSFCINVSWDPSIVQLQPTIESTDFIVTSYLPPDENYAQICGYSMQEISGDVVLFCMEFKGVGTLGECGVLCIESSELLTAEPIPQTIIHTIDNGEACLNAQEYGVVRMTDVCISKSTGQGSGMLQATNIMEHVGSGEWTLQYDSEDVHIVDVMLYDFESFVYYDNGVGLLNITCWNPMMFLTGNFTVVEIIFEAEDGLFCDSDIEIKKSLMETNTPIPESILHATSNGLICYCCNCVIGDMNGDCVFNAADIRYLAMYLNGDPEYALICGEGDVNCDGVVNAADIRYLAMYLNGDPEYIPLYPTC